MVPLRVRFRSLTRQHSGGGLTGREIARLAWLHLIARPAQYGHRGLFALAVARPTDRAEKRFHAGLERACQRFRTAAEKVTPDDWRAAADRLRASGTIPA